MHTRIPNLDKILRIKFAKKLSFENIFFCSVTKNGSAKLGFDISDPAAGPDALAGRGALRPSAAPPSGALQRELESGTVARTDFVRPFSV